MKAHGRVRFKFCLYVADNTENSAKARANLAGLCTRYLAGACEVEVVDVLRHPDRALKDAVFITPTLVKLLPNPVQRIVGTLADVDALVQVLGINGVAA